MSAVRDLTDALIGGGMHPADAAALVARAGAELNVTGPSKAALRTRKWRASRPSQTVTSDDSVTPNETVTERHQTSPNVTGDDASLSLSKPIDQEKKKKREAVRASQLPDGWRPDEPAWQAAVALIGAPRCELELTKFRNHAADKGRTSKNWTAAWRNWVDRAVEYGGRNGSHGKTSDNPRSGSLIAALDRALERSIAEDADLAASTHPLLSFSR